MGERIKCPRCNGLGYLEGINAANVKIGQRIARLRAAADMTQMDLAEKVGRSRAQIANIEAGKIDMPTSLIVKTASALGVDLMEILQ